MPYLDTKCISQVWTCSSINNHYDYNSELFWSSQQHCVFILRHFNWIICPLACRDPCVWLGRYVEGKIVCVCVSMCVFAWVSAYARVCGVMKVWEGHKVCNLPWLTLEQGSGSSLYMYFFSMCQLPRFIGDLSSSSGQSITSYLNYPDTLMML